MIAQPYSDEEIAARRNTRPHPMAHVIDPRIVEFNEERRRWLATLDATRAQLDAARKALADATSRTALDADDGEYERAIEDAAKVADEHDIKADPREAWYDHRDRSEFTRNVGGIIAEKIRAISPHPVAPKPDETWAVASNLPHPDVIHEPGTCPTCDRENHAPKSERCKPAPLRCAEHGEPWATIYAEGEIEYECGCTAKGAPQPGSDAKPRDGGR